MTTDLYTKSVLTVIALCLVYLCLGKPPVMASAQAQDKPSRVVITGWEPGPLRVFVAGWDSRFGGESVPVVINER